MIKGRAQLVWGPAGEGKGDDPVGVLAGDLWIAQRIHEAGREQVVHAERLEFGVDLRRHLGNLATGDALPEGLDGDGFGGRGWFGSGLGLNAEAGAGGCGVDPHPAGLDGSVAAVDHGIDHGLRCILADAE